MAIQEDIKRQGRDGDAPEQSAGETGERPSSGPEARVEGPFAHAGVAHPEADEVDGAAAEVGPEGAPSPTQLGTRRFVYAAYFAGAIGIAFLVSKVLDLGWLRLQNWKPAVGEPRDEVVMPVAAAIGALAAVYYWRRTRARQLAEEVATEMSMVTWPSRTEVTNGTFVVIVTTVISTVFFALMDKFWGFLTNLVYGGS
jgi:preprotein translocase subunit SecE